LDHCFPGLGLIAGGIYAIDMDLPEAVESTADSEPPFQEEPFVEGWRRRLVLRKNMKKQRRDVVYVAPDGTEIKNRKKLEKFLKSILVAHWCLSSTGEVKSQRDCPGG
jgi:hypothetical protein